MDENPYNQDEQKQIEMINQELASLIEANYEIISKSTEALANDFFEN